MDLTFQVPKQYCSLQHWTLFLPPDSILFPLWLSLFILSEALSPLFSSSILDTFQCHIFSPFCTIHVVLETRIIEWFAIPSSSGPCSVRTLHHDLSWMALHSTAHSFTELHKPVIHVIILVSFPYCGFRSGG